MKDDDNDEKEEGHKTISSSSSTAETADKTTQAHAHNKIILNYLRDRDGLSLSLSRTHSLSLFSFTPVQVAEISCRG